PSTPRKSIPPRPHPPWSFRPGFDYSGNSRGSPPVYAGLSREPSDDSVESSDACKRFTARVYHGTRCPLPRDAARLAATSSIRFSLLFHRDFARIRSRRGELDPHRLPGLEVWIAFLKTIPSVPRISRSR